MQILFYKCLKVQVGVILLRDSKIKMGGRGRVVKSMGFGVRLSEFRIPTCVY
jgi:hypothetical protein